MADPKPLDYYLAPRAADRNRTTPVAAIDPLVTELARERRTETSAYLKVAPPPDKAALANRIARDRGLPAPLIDPVVDQFLRDEQTQRFLDIALKFPSIAAWGNDKRAVAAAVDDHENLSLLGKAWEQTKFVGDEARKLGARALGTTFSGLWGGVAATAEQAASFDEVNPLNVIGLFGGERSAVSDAVAQFAKDMRALNQGVIARNPNSVENWYVRSTMEGGESTFSTLLGLGVAAATKNPAAAGGLLGFQVGGEEYMVGREAGLSKEQALAYGGTQGTIEFVTEKLPAARLLGDLASKTKFGKILARQLIMEIPQEQLATVLQDFNEQYTLYPEKTLQDYISARPEAAMRTFLATVGGVGATTAITTSVTRTVDAATKVYERSVQADQGIAGGDILDQIGEASAASKLRARDPESFRKLIDSLGADTGVDTVYIPGAAAAAYMQSDDYNPRDAGNAWFETWSDKIAEAEATGGDLVVPISDAATALAGTKGWETLRPDMRLTSGGMSQREAEAFSEVMEDVASEIADAMAAEDKASREAAIPREKLFDAIVTKLQDAGFTPTVARQQAELLAQRYATRSARMGRELTGAEFDDVLVRQVLPEGLARAKAASQLDIVANAVRARSKPASTGPTLLEWVAKQGGVEDRGGDIAAMGGKDWHRQKAFRRKLIRETAADQPSMLGEDGQQNSNTLDEMALRAWEAGYFPEFTERPTVNEMLDVIGAELRGQARFARTVEADDTREAADQLTQLLDTMGLDPATMTNKQIADAVERFASEQAEGRGYDQSFADGPRGRITFPAEGYGTAPSVIEMFDGRDLSTFLHETGHLWLEELRFDASDAAAPDQLRADWQVVQDWFAANGHAVSDGVIPVEAHEMWARGVERYLMEGKSPVPALQRLFEMFRGWLVSVYRSVDALKAPISPEIRDVMKRLIATDEQIAEAAEQQNIEALFADAAQAGMTGDEFAAYVETTIGARRAANATLLDKTMRAIRARVLKEYRDQEANVRKEVTSLVDSRPEFRGLQAARATPLNKEWITAGYGEDALSMLPKSVPPLFKENGADPDTVAEQSGFETGDELVRTLMGLEERRKQLREGGDKRSVREVTIAQETDVIMKERYGDPLNDGSIAEEALAAIHNDMQGEVIATELRVLARRTGRRPTPYALARQWARNKVRTGVVKEEASRAAVQRHQRSAAKAGKAAMEAMLAGDIDETFRHKQAQMVSNALASEAKAALEEVEAAAERMLKIARRKTMKSVDQVYLDQAHALLENVDLRARSQKSIDRQGKFEAWAAEQTALGYDIAVPPSFEATIGQTNWTRLSVENLLGLDDAVKQIIHLGRLKQTLLDNKERREFDAVVDEAVTSAGGLKQRPPSDMMAPTPGEEIRSGIRALDGLLLKMETVFDWLDQGNPNGVFNRIAFRPMVEAQEAKRKMLADYIGRLTGLLQAMPKADIKRWSQKVTAPELINRDTGMPWVFTRDQLVSIALNMGNAGNIQRLTEGYGWTQQGVMAALNRELSAADWTYVQSVWDVIETLWPHIEAMEKRINGIAPDKVEAVPFWAVPSNDPAAAIRLRGGYFPAIYDPAKSYAAEKNAGKDSDLFASIYTRATTQSSATKARAEQVKRPIHLSLGVINRHVMEVIHDITHREAVMQADKFLSSARVMKAVDAALSPEIRKQFRPWLQFVANEAAYDRAGMSGAERFIKRMRSNATFVGLGYRFSTVMLQLAGFSNSFERVGVGWVGVGIRAVMAHPVASFDMVLEKSQEVRGRMENIDRDIRDSIRRATSATGWISNAKLFAFHGIGYMDRIVVIPTWIGAYNKALAGGMSEQDAIYAADKAVRQSQGASAPKDLAAIQRGRGPAGEVGKLTTMFYTFFSGQYQRQRTLARDIGDAVGNRRISDMPALLARAWWLIVVPPILSELLAGRGPDDDEDWGLWAFQKMLMSMLGPIPILRDLAPVAWNKAADQPTFGYRFSPAVGGIESAINLIGDIGNVVEGEDTKRMTRNALETAGYVTGMVPGQLAASTQFLVDVGYGEQDPETFGDWYEGLTKGKIKED